MRSRCRTRERSPKGLSLLKHPLKRILPLIARSSLIRAIRAIRGLGYR